ncbi:hypothetical protein K466DRAFT_607928 [Polyporus arcularius HHB13444]|uniref:Uncharacterized protein n=1 Tax=Polyporus arcularius HHB13444 TaxID=1314778 RepID=A0A5C3NLU5_9APHY|nr:hypothetical protein K466DRAFT_607928 [Polyporus arcularius HHB13444]
MALLLLSHPVSLLPLPPSTLLRIPVALAPPGQDSIHQPLEDDESREAGRSWSSSPGPREVSAAIEVRAMDRSAHRERG